MGDNFEFSTYPYSENLYLEEKTQYRIIDTVYQK